MDRKDGDTPRLKKFNGRKDEDYNLWRRRVEFAFKGKKYSKYIQEEKCSEDMKDDACALLVGALGNVHIGVCQHVDSPLEMLKLLDQRYASSTYTAIIGLMGQVYSKRYSTGKPMTSYIDEFSQLFVKLDAVGEGCEIPDKHKAPILISSFGKDSPFESTAAALRLKTPQDLTWDSVSSLLIQEDANKGTKSGKQSDRNKNTFGKGNDHRGSDITVANRATKSPRNQDIECEFCGMKGHSDENCFVNPKSAKCKMSDMGKQNLKACVVTKEHANTSTTNKESNNTTVFGGFAATYYYTHIVTTPSSSHIEENGKFISANNAANDCDDPCLDSGASRTMFAHQENEIPNTYTRGSKEKYKLLLEHPERPRH